jgi:hypothetical protein
MAKIIAKLENNNYLLEINKFEIHRLNKLRVGGYTTGHENFDIGYEFPITMNIDAIIGKISKLTSINSFYNLKKELNETLEILNNIEENKEFLK